MIAAGSAPGDVSWAEQGSDSHANGAAPSIDWGNDIDDEQGERERDAVKQARFDEHWRPAPDSWFTTAPPPRRWLFRDTRRDGTPGVFPLGKCGQFIAAGGTGKTMALVALAHAVASGGKWFGSFSCGEPGPVLLLLGEEDEEECHRRLFNLARREGAPPSGSIVVMPLAGSPCAMLECGERGNPIETAFTTWLREQIAKSALDWRLIIIDPMSRFAGLEAEKDNAIATRFVQICESLASPTRSTLLSHHSPQSSRGKGAIEPTRGRGVTGSYDGARWEATLTSARFAHDDADAGERLGEIVTLEFTKSNYSKKPEPLLLRRDDHGALVALDDVDRDLVGQAKSGTTARATKAAERDRERAERERKEEEAKAAKAAAREAATRKRDAADDDCVRAILAETSQINARDLRAEVKKRCACGSERASDAIRRVRLKDGDQ